MFPKFFRYGRLGGFEFYFEIQGDRDRSLRWFQAEADEGELHVWCGPCKLEVNRTAKGEYRNGPSSTHGRLPEDGDVKRRIRRIG